MSKHTYVPIFKRRRTKQTNYAKRKTMIISKSLLLCIRISNKHSTFQFVQPQINGDDIKSGNHSSQLKKFGWTGSGKSKSGLYLTGYLAGKKAKSIGINNAILYTGMISFKSGSRLVSGLKGIIDSGISIPVGDNLFTDDEKLETSDMKKILKQIDSKYG